MVRVNAAVWRAWVDLLGASLVFGAGAAVELKVMCVVTSVLGFVSVVLSAVWAGMWAVHERQRLADQTANRDVLSLHGRCAPGSTVLPANPFEYANRRVENRSLVACVPLETREARRRKHDRNIGIATFSMLIGAAAAALVATVLMKEGSDSFFSPFHGVLWTGVVLYAVATGVGVIGFIVVVIPPATGLLLCRARPVERCVLMIADEESEMRGVPAPSPREADVNAAFLQSPLSNVLVNGVAHGMPVALPGPPVDSLYAPPAASGAAQVPPSAHRLDPSCGDAGGYQSATYYAPPPQLFNVRACSSQKTVE
ncbi:hypothetical protein NESM_000540100 [Novymonas esmeraldas]|uniref:Uncharacterized protein n=1 Tax=Novymonas esmeraldas TaxID=1808958 RepID=A0AAW0EPG8_9TRYP